MEVPVAPHNNNNKETDFTELVQKNHLQITATTTTSNSKLWGGEEPDF